MLERSGEKWVVIHWHTTLRMEGYNREGDDNRDLLHAQTCTYTRVDCSSLYRRPRNETSKGTYLYDTGNVVFFIGVEGPAS